MDNLVDAVEESAKQTAKGQAGRPTAEALLAALANKRRILITGHANPDPDALGAAAALRHLLEQRLPYSDAPPQITVAMAGNAADGLNASFAAHADLQLSPWDSDSAFDAIVLVDVQPSFPGCPLSASQSADVIVDHHRARGRKPRAPFVDIRTDVGSTTSIVFGYFMELDVDPSPALAATMLYAIESDLAGAAGQPSDLDNSALSTLTVAADTRLLYKMRHVELPRHYFVSYARALSAAKVYDRVLFAHLGEIRYLEKPAVMADFLLRFDGADYACVTGLYGDDGKGHHERLVVSLRAGSLDLSAGEVLRKAMADFGEGGGHRTKAGGYVTLDNGSKTEITRTRRKLRRRILRALRLPPESRGQKLLSMDCHDIAGPPPLPSTGDA